MAAVFAPLSPFLGVEVSNLSLPAALTAPLIEALKTALREHHVVAIRAQEQLQPADFIALVQAFGQLEPFFISDYSLAGHPEIYVLSNVRRNGEAIGRDGAGFHWHTDNSFTSKPTAVTFLHAIDVPQTGGDTLFANMHLAYEQLPQALKTRLQGKQAIHRYQKKEFIFSGDRWVDTAEKKRIAELKALRQREDQQNAPSPSAQKHKTLPDQLHPIVRLHPVSGRPALYLNEEMMAGIAGEPREEACAFLRELCRLATPKAQILRYRWRKGDIVIWDNASVMHTATYTDPAEARTLYRLTIEKHPE